MDLYNSFPWTITLSCKFTSQLVKLSISWLLTSLHCCRLALCLLQKQYYIKSRVSTRFLFFKILTHSKASFSILMWFLGGTAEVVRICSKLFLAIQNELCYNRKWDDFWVWFVTWEIPRNLQSIWPLIEAKQACIWPTHFHRSKLQSRASAIHQLL